MRRLTKVALVALAMSIAVLAWFAPNIYGNYRFKAICEKEGGLRVFHQLRRGVPWQSNSFGSYGVAGRGAVSFVRLPHPARGLLDYRYRSGPVDDDRSYEVTPADPSTQPVYEIRSIQEPLADELRLARSGYEVREIATDRLMLRWYQFRYELFDQDKTLLAAPSGVFCHKSGDFFELSNFNKYFINQ
jgi:hypothetical protein